MAQNRTWLAFANRKRCRHADAIHTLGFINWLMRKNIRFDIGDTVYLFMSDERRVRFKIIAVRENSKEHKYPPRSPVKLDFGVYFFKSKPPNRKDLVPVVLVASPLQGNHSKFSRDFP